jgi:hypothetical protein
VVPGQAQIGHRANRYRVPASVVRDDDGPLDDSLQVEDRDLGLVDDRRGGERSVASGIGDRERAAVDLVGAQLPRAGPSGKLGYTRREALMGELLRTMDHGHDQTVLAERDGDAEVDVSVARQRVAVERGVQRRVLLQCVDHTAGDERQVAEAELLPLDLERRHVRLDDRGAVGRRLQRAHHVLGNRAPHARQAFALLARGGRRGRFFLVGTVYVKWRLLQVVAALLDEGQ